MLYRVTEYRTAVRADKGAEVQSLVQRPDFEKGEEQRARPLARARARSRSLRGLPP